MADILGFTPDQAVAAVNQLRLESCVVVAGLGLTVYDALLSFPQELKCVWNRQFSVVTILYTIIRYGTILHMFFQVLCAFYQPSTNSWCKPVFTVNYIVDVACLFTVAAFDCLRVWGISRQRLVYFPIVFLLSMYTPAANIYNVSRPSAWIIVPPGPLGGCWQIPETQVYIYLPVISRAIAIVADGIVLLVTLLETASLFRGAREQHVKLTVVNVLVRNGAMQFFALLVLNTVSIVLDILNVAVPSTEASDASTFIVLNEVITSIILSHFLIDLRSVYLLDAAPASIGQVTTIQFSHSLVANMGASLDVSLHRDEEISESSAGQEGDGIQYSAQPLAVGLLNLKAESGINSSSSNNNDNSLPSL